MVISSKDIFSSNLNLKLSKNDEIENILNLYKIEEDRRKIIRHEEYVIKLCNVLNSIENNKVVPISKNKSENNLYALIDNHNYKEALEKATYLANNAHTKLDESIDYVLLSRINEEINKIKHTKKLSLNNNLFDNKDNL